MSKLPVNKERNWTPVKDGAELFDGVLNIADGVGLDGALDSALDIGKDLFEALEQASKVVKFAANLKQKWSPPAWERTAYIFLIRALKDLLRQELGRYPNAEFNQSEVGKVRAKLAQTKLSVEDLHGLNLVGFASNAFVSKLLGSTELVLSCFVLAQKQRERIAATLHTRFKSSFESLITQPRYDERTKDLRWALKANEADGGGTVDLLFQFLEYQRKRFTEHPLSPVDDFPLEAVFVEPNIPVHLPEWLSGAFHYQLVNYLRGPAGSGKSSLVKWAAKSLVDKGRIPITILMRDISPSGKDILSILDQAIARRWEPLRGKKLLDTPAFEALASAPFRENRVVLILDGLDELQIGTGATFQQSLIEFFQALQKWRFDHPSINVLITTRPGVDLSEIRWRPEPSTVDIQPLTAEGLSRLFAKIQSAIPADSEHWRTLDDATVEQLIDLYRQYLERKEQKDKLTPNATDLVHEDFCELLSLPQLATLAYRELGFSKEPLFHFLHSPTDLYRQTIDRAVRTAAKYDWQEGQFSSSHHLLGEDLRDLLKLTAVCITLSQRENVGKEKWEEYIKKNRPDILDKLQKKGYISVHDSLVASFYFRQDDQEGGCEFVHKSFREFLYAESLVDRAVEVLDYGSKEDRARRIKLLSDQINTWLSREVKQHVSVLLEERLSDLLSESIDKQRQISDWITTLVLLKNKDSSRGAYYFVDLLLAMYSSISKLRLRTVWPLEERTKDIDFFLQLNDPVQKGLKEILDFAHKLKLRFANSDDTYYPRRMASEINSEFGRPGGNFPAGWDAGGLFPADIGYSSKDTFWCEGEGWAAKMQGIGLMFNENPVAGNFWRLLKNPTYFFGVNGKSLSTEMQENHFLECIFIQHIFLGCRIQNARWYRCALQGARFEDCTLTASFSSCNLTGVQFERCGFYDMQWHDCRHDKLEFYECFAYGGAWPQIIMDKFDFSKPVSLHGKIEKGKWLDFPENRQRVSPKMLDS